MGGMCRGGLSATPKEIAPRWGLYVIRAHNLWVAYENGRPVVEWRCFGGISSSPGDYAPVGLVGYLKLGLISDEK